MRGVLLFISAVVWMFLLMTSCKKDKVVAGQSDWLSFSTDTLSFDTLFVSLGSTTQYFTVKNNHNKDIELDYIYLAQGNGSPYRLTIDGDPGNEARNLLIPAKDSVYIYVEVTVDPNDSELPFVILDEVVFKTKNSSKSVALQAYGQNAHFFNGEVIQTQVWTRDLPYVILNSIELEEGHSLTIQEGTTVYFGGGSGMFINGSLNIEGGQDSTDWVTFRGYRLDKQANGVAYDQLPGQWLGLFLMRESGQNTIRNFVMKGSEFGLNIGTTELDKLESVSVSNAPELRIENSIIYNHSVYGIYSFLAHVHATNLLIYNIGRNGYHASLGGNHLMEHSTIYLGSSNFFDHKEPSLYASDYHLLDKSQPPFYAPLNFNMVNTIVDGSYQEEVLFDFIEDESTVSITHSSLKYQESLPALVELSQVFQNEDNGFEDIRKSEFSLKENSILIGQGKDIQVPFDLIGKERKNPPDIGAFEF